MLAANWLLLFVPILGVWWFNDGYWRVLISSFFTAGLVHSLLSRFSPNVQPNSLVKLRRWILYCVVYFLFMGPLVVWCLLLTPAHLIWSPVEFFGPFKPDHRPVAPADVIFDPAAPGPSAIDISAIDADIFLVHGLGSNSNSSWTERSSGKVWPRDIFPNDFPTFRIIALSHDSRWDANAPVQTLSDYGSGILDAIEEARSRKEEELRPIIFVAHSFGGIIVKKALVLANEANPRSTRSRIASSTVGTLFLGTPHEGTPIADLAAIYSFFSYWRGSRAELLEFMSPNSKDIDALDEAFLNRYSDSIYICNFFETLRESWLNFPLFMTVQRRYARMRNKPLVALSANHRGLNKFSSENDGNYIKFRGHVKRAFKHKEKMNPQSRNLPVDLKLLSPVERNPKFIGREKDLAEIHRYLTSSVEDHQRVLLLYGTGGMGKSQLAVEYSHQNQDSYSAIFWIDAKTEQSTVASFIGETERLVRHLGRSSTYEEAGKSLGIAGFVDGTGTVSREQQFAVRIVQAFKEWLVGAAVGRWLLVFDNYDQLEDFSLTKFFPQNKAGRIIITSRRPDCKRLARYQKEVDVLEREEALSLLLMDHLDEEQLDATDISAAYSIIEEMEYFPLAIAQAQAYLQTMPIRLQQYLDQYRKMFKEVMANKPRGEDWKYNSTAFTTWEISFSAIQDKNSEAADMLLVCSFFNHHDILEEFIRRGLGDPKLGIQADELHVARLFEPLISYSLVKWRKSLTSFNIHAVVHAWARERMSVSERDRYARKALEMLGKAAPRDVNRHQSSTWAFERRLIIHIYWFFKASGFLEMPTCAFERVLLHYKTAIAQAFSQMYARPSQPGDDLLLKSSPCLADPDLIWLRTISISLKEQGDTGTTERILRKIIYAWDYPFGRPEDRWANFASALSDLASVIKTQGNLQEAEKLYQKALDGCIERLGVDNAQTLTIMSNLAIVLQFQGKLAEAESWHRKALHGWLDLRGPNDYNTAVAQNGLGVLLSTMDQLQEAESLFRQSLAVVKAISEDGNPRISVFESNLADILHRQGNYMESEEIFRRVIQRRTIILGDGHPHTLSAMVNLVPMLTDSGKAIEAEIWARKAIRGFEESLGANHIETILARRSLARALESLGRYSEAEELYKIVVKHFDETAIHSKDVVLTTLYELAGVLTTQGKFRKAEQHAKAALEGFTGLFGPQHKMVFKARKLFIYISKNL